MARPAPRAQVERPETIQQKLQVEIDERRVELAKNVQNAAGQMNAVQIAERTRLANFVDQLEALQKVPLENLQLRLINQIEKTQHHIDVYTKRAERFRWIAPATHRWMPDTPFKTLLVVCLFVLVCTVVKGIVRVWNAMLAHHLGDTVSYTLRKDFYGHMLRLDMAKFTEKGCGDLMNRCTSDLNHIGQGVQRLFGNACWSRSCGCWGSRPGSVGCCC
jgi:ABC-type multidrug transport system fused ATPase/permease subunit